MNQMNQMMRQAQAMQRKMAKATEALAEEEVTATAGGGMVKATATGNGTLTGLWISPEVVDPEDVGLLEDMVLAAVSEVLREAKALEEEKLGSIAGGLGLPPGLL